MCCNYLQYPQYPFLPHTEFIDLAATNYYTQSLAPLNNIHLIKNTEPLYLTNDNTIQSSHTGVLLNLPAISSLKKLHKYV